jgi:hypothetical protein
VSVRRTLLVLSIVLFLVAALAAQTPDTAIIRGRITDTTGAAIVGADVSLKNPVTGKVLETVTDKAGEYRFAGVKVGPASQLTAKAAGFTTDASSRISPTAGASVQCDVALYAAGATDVLNVRAVAGEVRTDQPQLGTPISELQIEAIPLLNRRITFLPLMNAANRPAISQGDIFTNQNLFTTNGAGRRQTWFEVDGSNGVDLWGRQTIFSTIPVDSVQEMTVLTNAFSAEFGAGTGSVVNVVTKSGGNGYHGSVLGLWRPSDTAAKLSGFTATTATSGNQITSDYLRQIAAQLSGPIGANQHTHFALNGEYSWQNRTSPITSAVAPGSFVGRYRGWLGYLRLDHELNDRNTIFLRANADSFSDTNPNGTVGGNTLPSVGRIFKRRTYSTQIGETSTISSTLLNAFRAQFQIASPVTEFDPFVLGTQFQVPIAGVGTYTTGTSQSAMLQNHQFEFGDTLSWMTGRHTVKFGADIVRAHSGGNSKEFGGPIYLGQFIYNTCALGAAVCESSAYLNNIANVQKYTQSYGNADYTVDDSLWSIFAQDDFRLRRDFTLNLGLRYERQTFTDATENFAPRIGFAYDLGAKGKTVVRAGYGIYYSQIPDNAAANYALTGPTGVFNYTAGPGLIGFPTTVASAPLPAFPVGALMPVRSLYIRPGRASYYNQFFPTDVLNGYPDALVNPYSQQWTLSLERQLGREWVLSADYVGTHTVKINRPLDLDAPAPFVRTAQGQTRTAQAANCTRPLWVWWYQQNGMTCNPSAASNPQPPYALIQADVNNGYLSYNALDINLNHRFSHRFQMLASYTWSHTLDNVDPDVPGQNPNDPNFAGRQEYGNAIYDQRHRFVFSGIYAAPFKFKLGGITTLASGLPFNYVTGSTNSGDNGGTADRPVINGAVVGRNAGRGRSIYDVSTFVERPIYFGERVHVDLRAEAFNLFNHPNFVGYVGTYGNGAAPAAGFGNPLAGVNAQLPARSLQFSARFAF